MTLKPSETKKKNNNNSYEIASVSTIDGINVDLSQINFTMTEDNYIQCASKISDDDKFSKEFSICMNNSFFNISIDNTHMYVFFDTDLNSSTREHKIILGRGANGEIYKGTIHIYKNINTSNSTYETKTIAIKHIIMKNIFDCNELKNSVLIPEHQNIIKYYGYVQNANEIYTFMDYIPGKNLFELLNVHKKTVDNKHLSTQLLFKIIQQLLDGIQFIHKNGFVHRDIKGQNIICNIENDNITIKYIDFGSGCKSPYCKIYNNKVIGTPRYICPYMISKVQMIEEQSAEMQTTEIHINDMIKYDMWAIGCVIYELCTREIFNNMSYEPLIILLNLYKIDKQFIDERMEHDFFNFYPAFIKELITKFLFADVNTKMDASYAFTVYNWFINNSNDYIKKNPADFPNIMPSFNPSYFYS